MPFASHLARFKDLMIRILSCNDEQSERPLHIGYPTDFRSEEVKMPGLTEAEQAFIREKAAADAQRIVAARPCNSFPIPSPMPDQISLPHHSPPLAHHQTAIDRVRSHARKLSTKIGYHGMSPEKNSSRPIDVSGDEATSRSEADLGVGLGLSKDAFFATQSRDSLTLGGSDGSLGLEDKETLAGHGSLTSRSKSVTSH